MKTIIRTFIYIVLLILPYVGFSQYGYSKATSLDVKGVFIGGTYTKAQVEAKWGSPTKYWSRMSEFGLDEEYDYSDNQFRFGDNGVFHSFYVCTPNFVVYTTFSGGIKVGDNISRVQAIGLGAPTLQTDGNYYLNRNNSDDALVFGHKNGLITWIAFESLI